MGRALVKRLSKCRVESWCVGETEVRKVGSLARTRRKEREVGGIWVYGHPVTPLTTAQPQEKENGG